MITCRLQGGLGNQMFQIAATYAVAYRNNDTIGLDFDNALLSGQGHHASKYRDTIFKKITETNLSSFRTFYSEPSFSYKEIPYQEWMILNGYFQSEKYFAELKYHVLSLFNLDKKNDIKIIKFFISQGIEIGKRIVSVHVRRGDYLKVKGYHPICTLEYYKEAIEKLGDANFIFVSDDMDWVRENFSAPNYFYSDFNDELMDMSLMQLCHDNIIANSSFSWWGAYLNPTEDKTIIAPKNWFGPAGPQDTQDLIPEDWIQI